MSKYYFIINVISYLFMFILFFFSVSYKKVIFMVNFTNESLSANLLIKNFRNFLFNVTSFFFSLSLIFNNFLYFGLMNFNDLAGGEIALRVVIPLLISVGFILMLKIKAFGLPLAAGIMAVVYAVSYFFSENMSLGGVFSGILLLATAGLILAAVLLLLTNRVKKVKDLHPIVFILGSAVVGIVFQM